MIITTEPRGIDLASSHTDAAHPHRPGRPPRALGLIARAVTLVVATSACATVDRTAHAADAEGLDLPPSFFAAFRKEGGLPVDGLTIGGPFVDRLPVMSGGNDYGFTEYLPWQQLRLTFDLQKVRDEEPILRTMRVLRKSLKLACGRYELQQYALGPKVSRIFLSQPTDTFMSDVYARLFDEGLIGGFECLTNSAAASPRIQVTWETGNRRPTEVIPALHWRFLVESVGREQMLAHQVRFEQHRRKVDGLRAKPTIGTDIQVMADDLPPALLTHFNQPTNRMRMPYAICGLITDIRGPLAQVQIQSDTLMLPIRKLFPAGQHSTADELSRRLEEKAPTQKDCLR